MPKQETVLKVFVASPSNVSEERSRLSSVIENLNLGCASQTGIRLEPILFEQVVMPDFDEDAQAVVNKQITQDYDIFIGIFWHTIGSKTNRAESGSIEEFNLAKNRFDNDKNSVRIMLYFKDAPPTSLSDIDPAQLAKVHAFRKRVADEGAFYETFSTIVEFERRITMHLMKLILEWDHKANGLPSTPTGCDSERDSTLEAHGVEDQSDDIGIIELEELLETETESINLVIENIRGTIVEIGENMNKRSKEVEKLNSSSGGKANKGTKQDIRNKLKKISKGTSSDMEQFVKKMEKDIPTFRLHHSRLLGALLKSIPIYEGFNQDSEKIKEDTKILLGAHCDMLESMRGFRIAINRIPKVSSEINRSKSKMSKSLQEFMDITEAGISMLNQIVSIVP